MPHTETNQIINMAIKKNITDWLISTNQILIDSIIGDVRDLVMLIEHTKSVINELQRPLHH